jgi:CRP/FNR family transcriptional regulator, cyclic AMP receptor protein
MSSRQTTEASTAGVEKLQIFRKHPLFGKLAPELLTRLCNYATTRKVKRGAVVISRGDPGTCLFMVASGTIKIGVQSISGKDAVFNLIGAGGIFGEIALLDGQPRTADAIAVTNCELLVIERRDFISLVHSNPDTALQIIEVLCERLRRTSTQVEDLMFLDLERRLAKTLLRLSETVTLAPLGPKIGQRVTITQREIGQIIGMSRESTNKQLRAWQDRKWLKIERGGITVLKPDALEKVTLEME